MVANEQMKENCWGNYQGNYLNEDVDEGSQSTK